MLGVTRRASIEDIQRAFRKKSMALHPDRNPNCKDCAEKMQDLSNAYEAVKKHGGSTVSNAWSGFAQLAQGELDAEQLLTTQLERWVTLFGTVSK